MNSTKIIVLLLICMSCTGYSYSQKKTILDKPKVDERVELLSIVSRLAGYNEYSSTIFKLYTDRIEKHFAKHKNHELVTFMKDMRASRGISYDAVMSMAVHLDDELNPRIEFTDKIPEARWGKDNGYKFVQLLKKFYADTKCKEFFNANKDLYKEVSDRFLPIYEELDLNWYRSFYGKEPSEKFLIVNGLGNGGGNYGVSFTPQNGEKEVYAIMGTWSVDSLGMAIFNTKAYFPTLLHEFNHSFVNDLLYNNEELFRDSGEKIFEVVKNEMASQAYGNWKTVLNEALVRASVIKYMIDHNFSKEEVNAEAKQQLDRSFLWIASLVKQLVKYDKQRETYPTLESYIPKLAEAYETFTIPEVVSVDKAEIASMNESNNGHIQDSWLEQIEIKFNVPMLGDKYSLHYGEKGKEAFPKYKKIYYSEDKESLIIEFGQLLEKDKEYQFVLKGENFKSQAGVSMKDKEINFKTPK